jgi:hypothetical protein
MHFKVVAPAGYCVRSRAVLGTVVLLGLMSLVARAASAANDPERPKSGPVAILKASEVKPGMHAVAWTVFEGTQPEPVPIEIMGKWKNMWGPGQDVIIGKMGGRATRTNVAGGMSGSPVYVDGKLIGAVALRLSVFSPDAICGITPIELMLEINDLDKSRPRDAKAPGQTQQASAAMPSELLQQVMAGTASPELRNSTMVPIDTPVSFAGFSQETMNAFAPTLDKMGIAAVAGGAGSSLRGSKPAADWKTSLQPGESVAGVLVSGDMSMTGLGTVTYNDGTRVLAFGHPFFNLGPVDMPMSKGEVLMVLASAYQPNKLANATEIVGALHQDRHSGIMGTLGEEAPMIPVNVTVRSLNPDQSVRAEKKLSFHVFQQEKWTPYLMTMTLFNSLSGLNEFREEATYRLSGKIGFEGGMTPVVLNTMQTSSGDLPMPAPMMLAGWWGDHFNRLYVNNVENPSIQDVNVTVDLLPERRLVSIESAWVSSNEAHPGDELPIKVFLRPYRGERIERQFTVKLPPGIAKGEHRILLSDAETLNRVQNVLEAGNRFIDIPQTVSLLNQERSNDRLYISLLESSPTAYYDDKTLPNLPLSILNVMQSGRSLNRELTTLPESASEQMSLPFDYVVAGSYTLKVDVK